MVIKSFTLVVRTCTVYKNGKMVVLQEVFYPTVTYHLLHILRPRQQTVLYLYNKITFTARLRSSDI